MNKDGYLKDAKKLYKLATKEYILAKKTKNEVKASQAAEKGYLCLLKTVNALFIAKGVKEDKVPKAEKGRLYFLTRYADRDFRKSYHSIRHSFHIDAFHDGIINFKDLDERFEDLEELIREVEER